MYRSRIAIVITACCSVRDCCVELLLNLPTLREVLQQQIGANAVATVSATVRGMQLPSGKTICLEVWPTVGGVHVFEAASTKMNVACKINRYELCTRRHCRSRTNTAAASAVSRRQIRISSVLRCSGIRINGRPQKTRKT